MTRVSVTADGSRPVALRQSGAVVVPVVVWAFCAVVVVLSLLEDGSVSSTVRTALTMASVAFLAWMFLFSPCLLLERDAIGVVNPLRAHRIPFDVLDEVQVRGLTSLVVRTPSGGHARITSWNAPGVPRTYQASSAPVAEAIEQRRGSWERSVHDEPAPALVTTWRVRPLLVLAVLAVVQVTIWWQ